MNLIGLIKVLFKLRIQFTGVLKTIDQYSLPRYQSPSLRSVLLFTTLLQLKTLGTRYFFDSFLDSFLGCECANACRLAIRSVRNDFQRRLSPTV